MRSRSLRVRANLLYSGLLLGILLVFDVSLYFIARSFLLNEVDTLLHLKSQEITFILRAYELLQIPDDQSRNVLESLLQQQSVPSEKAVEIDTLWRSQFEALNLKEDYINIRVAQGPSLMHSQNVTADMLSMLSVPLSKKSGGYGYGTSVLQGKRVRVINLPYLYRNRLPLILQVATPLTHTDQVLTKMMIGRSVISLILLALTSFLGSLFVSSILRPVMSVADTANALSHRDLSVRIPYSASDAEMEHLIQSFNNMLDRLQRAFTHANEFNANVAHELKTPLAIIRGELDLAMEQVRPESALGKMLNDSREEVDRMARVVKDLLVMAKLEYNPQALQRQKISVNEFFAEIIEHAGILAAEKHIAIHASVPEEPIELSGDRVHLRRLFLNLLANAVSYTPAQGTIALIIHSAGAELIAEVTDTGIGIAPEHLVKIFDKFFRIDHSSEPASTSGGSGLGLSLAQAIARAHMGKITVRSTPGKGTTFTVFLPLSI